MAERTECAVITDGAVSQCESPDILYAAAHRISRVACLVAADSAVGQTDSAAVENAGSIAAYHDTNTRLVTAKGASRCRHCAEVVYASTVAASAATGTVARVIAADRAVRERQSGVEYGCRCRRRRLQRYC